MDRYVVIDLETTGHSPNIGDKIIEVGIVVIENEEITDEFSTFLHPGKPIPEFITHLTGITDEHVGEAPTFTDKAIEIIQFFNSGYLVAHNVSFDRDFLNAELKNIGIEKLKNPVLDTVELSRILFPSAPGYKLGQLAEYLDIQHFNPHRALSDAYVTAQLLLKLKRKFDSLPFETIEHLLKLEKNLRSDLFAWLNKRKQTLLFRTETDEQIVSYRGLAFRKTDEDDVKDEITSPSSFGNYLDEIYEKNGKMEQTMRNYEKRPGQRKMSEAIYDAFNEQKHALIEAETGTGKSVAYLLSAIYEAVTTNDRIVISTYTTQLQAQLLEEDIPLLRRLIPFPFHVVLLKGKRHYISLEKLEQELQNDDDHYGETITKAMIVVWLTETTTGDIDEIQIPSSGKLFYKKVSTEAEGPIDPTSPWFTFSYYQKARKKAQNAHLVITNHALLCTDLFNDYQLLPSYHKVIIDEAHHLEKTASRHYGLKLDYMRTIFLFNQIGSEHDGKWLTKLLTHHPFITTIMSLDKWNHVYQQTKYDLDILFRTLYQYVLDQQSYKKSLSDTGKIQYRMTEHQNESKDWQSIIEMVQRLSHAFQKMIAIFEKISDCEQLDKHFNDQLNNNIEMLKTFRTELDQLFLVHDQEQIKWIEIEAYGAKNAVYLFSEPKDVSPILTEYFFDVKETVILTSATLTMKNSFSFIEKSLGLPAERLIKEQIESPFSYANQVQLLIPKDFPDVRSSEQNDFIYATCEAIVSLAEITNGRMLVLFTSYDMLSKSYHLLKEIIDTNKYILIAQGVTSGSRMRLKKKFQTYDHAILLGTNSFWEGIDIPGEDLSCLMIVRLPFQPPNHPVFEAKTEYLKQAGKNAFIEQSLPNAVIRFKQGFGRLIRSKHDRGIVFVCDARLKKARYGSYFIDSIPNVPIHFDTTSKLIKLARTWFMNGENM